MPIVNISAVRLNESRNVCLVGVTQFGIRLYFSIIPFEQFQSMSDVAANGVMLTAEQKQQQLQQLTASSPSTFQLIHVRIPPNIDLSAHQSASRHGPICSAYCNDGLTLMITKKDEQTDSCLLLNRDLFLLHNIFKEAKFVFDVNGRIWSAEEIVPSLSSIRIAAGENELLQTAKSAAGLEFIPKLTAEYFDMPRRFAMITPQVPILLYFILRK
jgi:hypothetical protein